MCPGNGYGFYPASGVNEDCNAQCTSQGLPCTSGTFGSLHWHALIDTVTEGSAIFDAAGWSCTSVDENAWNWQRRYDSSAGLPIIRAQRRAYDCSASTTPVFVLVRGRRRLRHRHRHHCCHRRRPHRRLHCRRRHLRCSCHHHHRRRLRCGRHLHRHPRLGRTVTATPFGHLRCRHRCRRLHRHGHRRCCHPMPPTPPTRDAAAVVPPPDPPPPPLHRVGRQETLSLRAPRLCTQPRWPRPLAPLGASAGVQGIRYVNVGSVFTLSERSIST